MNKPGTSAKLEWAEDHTNLYDKNKHDNDFLFVYTDSSLSYDKGTHKTGYGVVAYRNDKVLATENGTLREYVEAYDAEMKALEVASTMIHNLFNNENNPPSKIIISTNNTGAIQRIFQGSPGKDQMSSLMFRKNILDLLDRYEHIQFAFTWCPGHFDIEGNETADQLAKSGSRMTQNNIVHKSLSYLGGLHKQEIGKEWQHRWTNHHTTLWSKFHVTNRIPPSTKPTKRFTMLDR